LSELEVAFRVCRDQRVFLGGSTLRDGSIMEINAWVSYDGAAYWNKLTRKQLGSFARNCTVRGC